MHTPALVASKPKDWDLELARTCSTLQLPGTPWLAQSRLLGSQRVQCLLVAIAADNGDHESTFEVMWAFPSHPSSMSGPWVQALGHWRSMRLRTDKAPDTNQEVIMGPHPHQPQHGSTVLLGTTDGNDAIEHDAAQPRRTPTVAQRAARPYAAGTPDLIRSMRHKLALAVRPPPRIVLLEQ